MPEAKLMPEFEQHPKVEACDLASVGLLALGLSYAARELTDGLLSAEWVENTINSRDDGSAAVVQQLVDRGLLEPVDGGYRVHDYADHNPTRADLDRRRREREKKRRQRQRGLSPGTSPSAEGTSPSADLGSGENSHSDAGFPLHPAEQPGPTAPGDGAVGGTMGGSRASTSRSTSARSAEAPGASATALSAKRARDEFDLATEREWSEWLSDYRLITENSRVLGSAAARRAFAARRREGRTLEDLKLATRGNWHQWGTGAERPNLNWTKPETVLRAANVEGYIAQGHGLESGQVPRGHASTTHPASRRIAERLRRSRIGGLA